MSLNFSVSDWSAWMPGIHSKDEWSAWSRGERAVAADEALPASEIPPLLRRRLSPMGRAAINTILPLFEKHGPLPIIYCSRHGETARTVEMLQSLAADEPLSPTAFSLSVHNAICGLFSIHSKTRVPITAIASGEQDLAPSIIEGLGLAGTVGSALCVFCDWPLPELYKIRLLPEHPFAVALVIKREEQFDLEATERVSSHAAYEPQVLTFLRMLCTVDTQSLELDNWLIRRL